MTNAMGGANLHTPPSIFQHIMAQQNTSQQAGLWMQTPQVPSMTIPRNVPSLQQLEISKFTGARSFEMVPHQKRKLETLNLLDMRQTKQFITEEKMAAHFKDMHISTNYQAPASVPSTSTKATQPLLRKELNMDLDVDATNVIDTDGTKSGPRLILSEELKRLQQEPILPNSLLSKLERPTMALVVWEPPSKHLRILSTRDISTPIPDMSDDNNNNNNNNNNNDAVSDLNHILPSNSPVFEPMEL